MHFSLHLAAATWMICGHSMQALRGSSCTIWMDFQSLVKQWCPLHCSLSPTCSWHILHVVLFLPLNHCSRLVLVSSWGSLLESRLSFIKKERPLYLNNLKPLFFPVLVLILSSFGTSAIEASQKNHNRNQRCSSNQDCGFSSDPCLMLTHSLTLLSFATTKSIL